GKGNPEWNCTAPHGAGRKITRTEAQQNLSYTDFVKAMEGIYSTSVKPETLDEAPAAYKNPDDIINNISETANIREIITPTYNFKDN
ncbi:RtcB family protein, partial [bacterium]|nr:RtcB family protein [bacterium]